MSDFSWFDTFLFYIQQIYKQIFWRFERFFNECKFEHFGWILMFDSYNKNCNSQLISRPHYFMADSIPERESFRSIFICSADEIDVANYTITHFFSPQNHLAPNYVCITNESNEWNKLNKRIKTNNLVILIMCFHIHNNFSVKHLIPPMARSYLFTNFECLPGFTHSSMGHLQLLYR